MNNPFSQKKTLSNDTVNNRFHSIRRSGPFHFRRYKKKYVRKNNNIGCCFIPFISLIILTTAFFIAFSIFSSSDKSGNKIIISGGNGPDTLDIIKITGEISDSKSSLKSHEYNHSFVCSKLDNLINDNSSSALLLCIDTPGGAIYETDELYSKIMKYKNTGRPVYSYLAETAASGGYYIASCSTEIFANRNCITGSIGVTMGTLFDFSEFMSKNGVKVYNLNAGSNKSMGSMFSKPTDEQLKIYQSILDESYENFIKVVMDGRGLGREETLRLADGRIYTANQALENKLIDEISEYDNAVYKISNTYLKNATVREHVPAQPSFLDRLLVTSSTIFQTNISHEIIELDKTYGIKTGYYMNIKLD